MSPRAALRAELIERGYDATGFVTLEDVAASLMRTQARRPALLVLDRAEQVVADAVDRWIPVLPIRDQELTWPRPNLP